MKAIAQLQILGPALLVFAFALGATAQEPTPKVPTAKFPTPKEAVQQAGQPATSQQATPQQAAPPSQQAASQDTTAEAGFSAAQLEQMAAPIALYPDSLVTQILMASTYPLEIVEAARWLQANAALKGAELEAGLAKEDWDASVKSMCGFADVLQRMNENLDWTQDLGDAFLAQKADLLDAVQRMRGKAYEAGSLETTEQQVVTQQPDKIIVIEPADPEVVYVPTYSPTVVYGSWSYSSWYYPPMYVPPAYGYGAIAFTAGVVWGAAMWGGANWGWGHGDVDIDIDRQNNFNRNTNANFDRTKINNKAGDRASWKHDASHRGGVNYRDGKTAQQHGAREGSNRVTRDQARGYDRSGPSARNTGQRGPGAASGTAARRDLGTASSRSGASDRGVGSPRASSRNSAFSGSRSAGMDRAASHRGSMSRGGGGMRGGGGRRR